MGRWHIYDQFGNYRGTAEDGSSSGRPNPVVILVLKLIAFGGLLYLFGKAFYFDWIWNSAPLIRPSMTEMDDVVFLSGLSWIGDLWKAGGFFGKLEVIQNVAAIVIPVIVGLVLGSLFQSRNFSWVGSIIVGVLSMLLSLLLLSFIFGLFDIGPEGYLDTAMLYFLSYILNIIIVAVLPITIIVCIQAMDLIFVWFAGVLEMIFPFLS